MEARGATDGERKTITALFADIKGSMAILEGFDPEEARQVIDPALQIMMEAVHRYEGYVGVNQVLVLVFEDLHWLDAETQAFLTLLSESIATSRILLLIN